MPSISFFADAEDMPLLVGHLNDDPEVAFLLVPLDPLGPPPFLPPGAQHNVREQRRWQAVPEVTRLGDGCHTLWHTRSPEPLCHGEGARVADPWAGWRGDTVVGVAKVLPEVTRGLDHLAIVYLHLETRHHPYTAEERAAGIPVHTLWADSEVLVVSHFSWIGGHFKPAPKVTTLWWGRFRRRLGKTCAKLTAAQRGGPTFYAFPSALALLKGGIKYYAWGWDLGASIRAARLP